jgi:hypothetical protein
VILTLVLIVLIGGAAAVLIPQSRKGVLDK